MGKCSHFHLRFFVLLKSFVWCDIFDLPIVVQLRTNIQTSYLFTTLLGIIKLIQVRLMGDREHACYVYIFGVKQGYHPLPLRALFVSLVRRDSLSFRLIFSVAWTLTGWPKSILGRGACGRWGEDTQISIYQARGAGEWRTKLRYGTSISQLLIVCNDIFAAVLSPAITDSIWQRTSPVS